jgi:tRNA wybutosine-synthesizing protein 3
MDKFTKTKQKQLGLIDKSDKGDFDIKIKTLCDKINKSKNYYTTSSCSGRIVLIIQGERKKSGLFLYRTHSLLKYKTFIDIIKKASRQTKKIIGFKQEPFILHVACSSLEKAKEILNLASKAGFKRINLISFNKRIICEINSTEKLELPLISESKLLVSEKYLKILVKQANKNLKKSWEKIKKFEDFL